MPKILGMSRQLWEVTETKISAGPSRITGPAELIEMVQYTVLLWPIIHVIVASEKKTIFIYLS